MKKDPTPAGYGGYRSVWHQAAALLGWHWSQPHDGYIREGAYRPDRERGTWGSYWVAESAEDACFYDSLETEDEARAYIRGQQEIG